MLDIFKYLYNPNKKNPHLLFKFPMNQKGFTSEPENILTLPGDLGYNENVRWNSGLNSDDY